MSKRKIIAIIGARPQFIKHFPFEKEAIKHFNLVTIHTGQHYDENMSKVFFDQLGMQVPSYMLSLKERTHGAQTGEMLNQIEKIVLDEKPDAVVVYGDTNSTLAGALVASKLNIKLIHIEAGLRSYNKRMPEEINRITTDHVSDLLLCTSEQAISNLNKENIDKNAIVVGDIMKDLILYCIDRKMILESTTDTPYLYVTLHRPYNVDSEARLKYVLESLGAIKDMKIIFAIHPRTKNNIQKFSINLEDKKYENIEIIDPQPYIQNLSLLFHSRGLITDSGGMQKEAYWLKKKCATIRSETEWVETLAGGANKLFFEDLRGIGKVFNINDIEFDESLYGDGKAAIKMCSKIIEILK